MKESILEERIGNFRISIYFDTYYNENPRIDWDNVSHMVVRSRYVSAESDEVEDTINSLCAKYDIDNEDMSFYEVIDALNEFIVIKPISIHVHSGMTVFFGKPTDRWDSGIIGFGYIEHEDLYRDNCGRSKRAYPDWRDQCSAIMESEMWAFDRYVRGDIYGFTIEELEEPSEQMKATPEYDEEWWEEDERNWHIYDSCGGFYDNPEAVMEEAKRELPSEVMVA